ncbi:MAG TPA: sigma 54-interacting transcriptional regulator [Accumulibacter sp.]|uniref:Quorum-sensing regulator protein F n=2 Tax=Candidatus Accumulibacter TaxID=327159 RepID=A0A080M4W7_9PROT|nr:MULTISPECIES: sigma 54-interacting transcriptional regulator [Candidatus Accumulibacter]KFB75535.1 MAG: Quorum-sensing regulator protein F [Candidatus Accumulibacter cognatus]MBL8399939.1 sigma 54-interacting transcriptional regulator [Accumulibacter sp.]MBN8519148.1 sigma 54-interacting transcriptional regulator [Accumulibacter sp.]MBO3710857.1 sigma 54-interacting transcriptional regulator [Accumulibacter sp.]MCC2867961.1 sigma 54-interacting transcriptional regulator [Candidatus Accumuli
MNPVPKPHAAHVLLIDDDADLLRLLSMRLHVQGLRVSTAASAEEGLARIAVEPPQLVISDIRLPGKNGLALFDEIRSTRPTLPVILLTAHGTIPDAVQAMSRGVFGYLTKPFDSKHLLEKIAQALQLSAAGAEHETGKDEAWREGIVFRSSRMGELIEEARVVAASDASVLIRGESGTGKEILARAIHRASARAKAPFVAINCGAIPEQLLESELFGHVRGAFTGASATHLGLFQSADGGTLFLDEIGDMPLALQVKLLRVLQERAVRPVGATRAEPVDVRVLSATHRNLEVAMAEGQFREDLYYRLDVVTMTLPRLDERREDIPLLATCFVQQLARKYDKPIAGIAPEALEALASAAWPGNVRQLYNVVEQSCALATTPLISLALIQRALRVPAMEALSYAEAKQRFERNYLVQLLKLTDGNVADAARIADRNRTEFYRLLQKHELTPAMFRGLPGNSAASER